MNLSKEQKIDRSSKLAEEIKASEGLFFASYQGLKFVELARLREKLTDVKAQFRVERNSVVNFALRNAEVAGTPDILKGPTAITILKGGDIVEAAKVLAAFEKEFPALKIKAGYATKNWFSEEDCKKLSMLGTRAETLSHLACALYTSVSRIASVLQAPIRDLAFALKALEDKKREGETAA
ncbi:MAG: 50S ribosomal protein L10 [Elusimicrobiaceae bacterium]|nr:50S ribosomal protein L10 [Elusimicrobiaceae bacterium]